VTPRQQRHVCAGTSLILLPKHDVIEPHRIRARGLRLSRTIERIKAVVVESHNIRSRSLRLRLRLRQQIAVPVSVQADRANVRDEFTVI